MDRAQMVTIRVNYGKGMTVSVKYRSFRTKYGKISENADAISSFKIVDCLLKTLWKLNIAPSAVGEGYKHRFTIYKLTSEQFMEILREIRKCYLREYQYYVAIASFALRLTSNPKLNKKEPLFRKLVHIVAKNEEFRKTVDHGALEDVLKKASEIASENLYNVIEYLQGISF